MQMMEMVRMYLVYEFRYRRMLRELLVITAAPGASSNHGTGKDTFQYIHDTFNRNKDGNSQKVLYTHSLIWKDK